MPRRLGGGEIEVESAGAGFDLIREIKVIDVQLTVHGQFLSGFGERGTLSPVVLSAV